jgi:hypothetical protein
LRTGAPFAWWACLELKLFPADVRQALGIPVSITGNFDRAV